MTKVFEKSITKVDKKQPGGKEDWKVKLKSLRKDLGRLNELLEGKKMNKHQDNLQKRYKLKKKGKWKVKEEILPRIRVKLAKIIRYQQRVSQFQQNRFFRNNEG